MSDLVERLRAANTWLNEGDCCGQLDASGTCMAPACIFGEALKMAHEAAARIAQLEAALAMFVCDCTVSERCPVPDNCRNFKARRMLEERT